MGETPEKPEVNDQGYSKEPEKREIVPPAPQKGVPIDEAPEQNDEALFSWKLLVALYGAEEAEKFKSNEASAMNDQVEKAIRENPEYATKVQEMIEKPEDHVSKEEAPAFKTWLLARFEAAKKNDDSNDKDATDEKTPEKTDESGEKKETSPKSPEAASLEKQMDSARNMSNEELMSKIFEKLGAFIETLSKGGLENLFGLGGPSFSKTEIDSVKVDIEAAEKKEYDPKSENKAVEYVCNALNLPVKNNIMALLYSLKNSPGVVYETDKNTLSDAKVGDVLFFRKEGETQPYLSALVSDIGPPVMMKYMDESGEIKQEEVLKSSHYEQDWFGFVKFPQKETTTETPQQ